ncbi:MAG: hypothetical protein ABR598_04930 [Candidatus Dormibacteria bacterium]
MRERKGGQVIPVLAVALLVMVAAIGLAVDGGFVYYWGTRTETAAIAGAAAGARHLPDFATAASDAEGAVKLNGLAPTSKPSIDRRPIPECPSGPGAGDVSVCVSDVPAGATPEKLRVTVTRRFSLFFLQVVGAGPTIVVSRTAERANPNG